MEKPVGEECWRSPSDLVDAVSSAIERQSSEFDELRQELSEAEALRCLIHSGFGTIVSEKWLFPKRSASLPPCLPVPLPRSCDDVPRLRG
jgi:hypothetical protein